MNKTTSFGSMLALLLLAGTADAVSYTVQLDRPCGTYRLNRDAGAQLLVQCLQDSNYITVLTVVDATCPKTSWVDSKDGNGNITLTCKGPRLTR